MELSTAKTQEAKKMKVSVQEMLFADLITIGYSETDAYAIAYPENIALSTQYLRSHRTEITSKARFKQLCEERRMKNAGYLSVSENAEDISLISASEVAKEILLAAQKQPIGSKDRADLMAKYNDIRKENEKEIGGAGQDPVQFFFPLACGQCPLLKTYNAYLEEKNAGKKEEDWELEIRPDEMQRIIETAERQIKKMRK